VDRDLAIRRAEPRDIPAIREILRAHDADSAVVGADIVGPYVRHLVERAIALVAERDGVVVAYGAAVDTGRCRHLADLFVRPDLLGRGIGRRLLDAVLGDAAQRTTFASADPRALPLYVRAAMAPLWPLLELEGSAARLAPPGGHLVIQTVDAGVLSGLEHAWTGSERPVDHAFWASQAESEPFVVITGGEPVAFAYARARQISGARAIDRLLVRPEAEPVAPTLAAIRHAGRGGSVVTHVAGPSPVLPALLAAGFLIKGHDQFLATDPSLVDPARFIPNSGML
jgi:GNAT superfamily N-acetyltransferase